MIGINKITFNRRRRCTVYTLGVTLAHALREPIDQGLFEGQFWTALTREFGDLF